MRTRQIATVSSYQLLHLVAQHDRSRPRHLPCSVSCRLLQTLAKHTYARTQHMSSLISHCVTHGPLASTGMTRVSLDISMYSEEHTHTCKCGCDTKASMPLNASIPSSTQHELTVSLRLQPHKFLASLQNTPGINRWMCQKKNNLPISQLLPFSLSEPCIKNSRWRLLTAQCEHNTLTYINDSSTTLLRSTTLHAIQTMLSVLALRSLIAGAYGLCHCWLSNGMHLGSGNSDRCQGPQLHVARVLAPRQLCALLSLDDSDALDHHALGKGYGPMHFQALSANQTRLVSRWDQGLQLVHQLVVGIQINEGHLGHHRLHRGVLRQPVGVTPQQQQIRTGLDGGEPAAGDDHSACIVKALDRAAHGCLQLKHGRAAVVPRVNRLLVHNQRQLEHPPVGLHFLL
mmetsp:Transcript_3941/g.6496  ORF Transcript_3941/g.6496 Transcript_3941/m.6496 type:complete len:400 (+) Transcript_3941:740-1939(+)